MRAVLVKDGAGPADNLYIGEVPMPEVGPRQVLVKIKAFGLNRMDISQREGKYPPPPGASSILGVEFSGLVSEIGPDVTEWAIGDQVLGLAGGGAYAEYIAIAATHILKKPDHLSWAQAASIPEVFLTAYQALVLIGKVHKGDDVLIHAGASGVGIAAAQLARYFGAHTVTVTASTQEKIDWLLRMPNGPTHAANYKTEDFAAVVKQVTDGKGASVVIDFVGQSHFNKNLEALAVDGRMTMLALLSGPIVEKANLSLLLYKRLHIEGSTLRSRSATYQADLIQRFTSNAFHHISGEEEHGSIKTYIHRVYPWEQIQEAHKEMEANQNIGKIVVEVV
ncbi:quinone oxidoreductase putative [Macrolepiota fuliginosa MF-IS2]|uniref:Quinone oxidoreductase putative n=1 Tax=Macrolepiota fuliginosa MF-IS2 TaxID=1400762 RepID=A0A9P5XML2_9AGAR|nr:quinone oxidoreductase putative [Macrolepiota fuliginosa MF-IS2]